MSKNKTIVNIDGCAFFFFAIGVLALVKAVQLLISIIMKNERKGKAMFSARDTRNIIVDDENMKHVDLFGDILPMCVVFLLLTGFVTWVVIRVLGMIFNF